MNRKSSNNLPRGPFVPFVPPQQGTVTTTEAYFQEALVIDVIVSPSHSEYADDGYNVGVVKFKFIQSDHYRPEDSLNWAFSLDTNISDYPLINEIILVCSAVNRFFYMRKVNISNRTTNQAYVGLRAEMLPPELQETKASNYAIASSAGATKQNASNDAFILGDYFIDPTKIYRLQHDEGDIIYEGRLGQSIRFGAAWTSGKTNFLSDGKDQASNLMLRAGQDPGAIPSVDSQFGVIKEDINKDFSSVWLVSDQVVNLETATTEGSENLKSIDDYPKKFNGEQIIINSNRVIINAKKDKILGHSNAGIHWTSNKNFTVDSGADYLSWIGGKALWDVQGTVDIDSQVRASVVAPQVFLGTKDDNSQPVAGGELLAEFLGRFLDAHIQNFESHVITAVGPGVLNPAILAALIELKTDVALGKFASFNSDTVFTKVK